MNRTPSSRPSPPVGEKVPGGRLRGIPTGSWPQVTSKFWRCPLSMNLLRVADPRSGARLCEAQRFMVSNARPELEVEALHEPS